MAVDNPTIVPIQIRRDTASAWAVSTRILKNGEPALDTDNHLLKFGTGDKTFSQVTDYFELARNPPRIVANLAARLALSARIGDVVKQADTNITYVLRQLPASVDANWLNLGGGAGGGIESYAVENLPTAPGNNKIANVTNFVRGLYRYVEQVNQWVSLFGAYNLKDHGAVGDGQEAWGSINAGSAVLTINTTKTLPTVRFKASDQGKSIQLRGAGAGGANLFTTILSYQSPTQVTLAVNAGMTISNKQFAFGTDDTDAINALTVKIIAAGGGKIYAPESVYLHSGVSVPKFSLAVFVKLVSVPIYGCYQPPTFFGTLSGATERLPPQGTVFLCYSDTKPNVQVAPGDAFESFNLVLIKTRYITFRTHESPKQPALDFYYASQMIVKDCVFDTGVMNVLSSEPTTNVPAIRPPKINNGALSILENCIISGFYRGIDCEEHLMMRDVVFASCKIAMYSVTGYHDWKAERILCVCCQNHLTVDNTSHFKISQLTVEHKTPENVAATQAATGIDTTWQIRTSDINDPANLGNGSVQYKTVKGGLPNAFSPFLTVGCGNIIYHPIGDPPTPKPTRGDITSALVIPNATLTELAINNPVIIGQGITYNATTKEFTVTRDGTFSVSALAVFAPNSTGFRQILIQRIVGGSPLNVTNDTRPAVNGAMTTVELSGIDIGMGTGQKLKILLYQNSGGDLALTNAAGYLTGQIKITRVTAD